LAAAAVLLIFPAERHRAGHEVRFGRMFAASILLPAVFGMLRGPDSAAMVAAALAPPLCLVYFIYAYQVLDLLISRRIYFALTLGVVLACYLFIVRRLAGFLEDSFEAFGPLTELILIFGAAFIWIPLYGWITRFLSKRTQVYAEFSKRLIEDAAGILDLMERVQFLAEEVARTFRLRRVLLVTTGAPVVRGEYPRNGAKPASGEFASVEEILRGKRPEVVHPSREPDARLAAMLEQAGFNYLFPLWYEERLNGLLLVNSSPRMYLDEDESILLGLSRQISHSIETCRVVDVKIGLERALARQEHLASLGKVAATIAHEIKNPLSSVKTLAQLMREDPEVNEKYDRDLGYIVGEVDRLNRSVMQLLSFSRPAPEERAEVNLTELLETMTGLLERQYAGGQIAVRHRIAQEIRMAHGNAEIIRQVVLNLVLNAIQASEPGGEVRLEARQEAGRIELSVTDQGPGIPAEMREKIFEPFYTTKQRGTGLGLAIVRKNLRQLGGGIFVESPVEEGRGTRMRVTLPSE
jgi:signal transduction histidine kinase